MKRLKIAAACVLAVFVLTGVWQGSHWFLRWRAAGPQWLVNQVWIERMPRDERDMFFQLLMVEHEDRRIGVTGRSSRWRSHFDLFQWNVRDDVVNALFPQDNRRLSMKARTWACQGEAPRPFELCLELRGQRQTFKLYSRKDWVIRPGQEPPADLKALAPALGAVDRTPAQALPAAGTGDDGISLIE